MLNSYGNDLSEATRMNNAADAMKRDRLGTPADPVGGSLAGAMTSLFNSLNTRAPAATASPPAVTNSFGNDMTEANRMNAGADAMKKSRLGTTANPADTGMKGLADLFAGSQAGSLLGAMNKPIGAEPTDTRTWGDIEQKPYFSGVSNAGAMGGNF